jgi:anaerobic selenocysteine-containing dehydrogenase
MLGYKSGTPESWTWARLSQVMAADLAYRVCPLCEATCGLELTVENGKITRARGDQAHVFSHGFICPKGAAYPELIHDPDRLRRPMVHEGSAWREVGWDEAFSKIASSLRSIVEQHGRDSVAIYLGNPTVHSMAYGNHVGPMLKAFGSKNLFSAATADQMPKHVSCGYIFGDPFAVPVPDVDRSDLVVILGANPWESNGSLATAPDFRGRLKAVQARGGRFVVVDPRRTATAAHADEYIAIRPGTDALLLFAVVNVLFSEHLLSPGRLAEHVNGVDGVRDLAARFTPARVASRCGVDAERIVALARSISAARSAAVYGRIGTTTVEFGTLTSWLVDVVNILTGNLDRPGGAMFPMAAHLRRRSKAGGRGFLTGRWRSRVSGHPEVLGEFPIAALAEEIETPGDGQVRALLTVAGNPARSAPNSRRLEAALDQLEFVVSVDPYLNETTRHADVILPPASSAQGGHYDYAFNNFAIHNTATYSPPTLAKGDEEKDDGEILARLALIAGGQVDDGFAAFESGLLERALARAVADPDSPAFGRDAVELRAMVGGSDPSEQLLDIALRSGAYGDGFGAQPDGLSLARLLEHPHGVDLGPLQPRIPEVLRTASGRIELCPEPIAGDVARLHARLDSRPESELVLVGRRHLRSNNSWMHNVPMLVSGPERCTLQVHPVDAARLDLTAGGLAHVRSRVGEVDARVEVTEDVSPGVVSLPHGWGHDGAGMRMAVAVAHAGVNSNALTDDAVIDPLSGNAVLNGIPVQVVANGR